MKNYFLFTVFIFLASALSSLAQDQAINNLNPNPSPVPINMDEKAKKMPPPENYMFKSVKVGNVVLLIDQDGKQIGSLRNIGGTVMCYDMKNKTIGMIQGKGNAAVLLDPKGKQIGLASKVGDTYTIYNSNGTKAESRIQIAK